MVAGGRVQAAAVPFDLQLPEREATLLATGASPDAWTLEYDGGDCVHLVANDPRSVCGVRGSGLESWVAVRRGLHTLLVGPLPEGARTVSVVDDSGRPAPGAQPDLDEGLTLFVLAVDGVADRVRLEAVGADDRVLDERTLVVPGEPPGEPVD